MSENRESNPIVLSRRGFLRGAIGGGATALLAACGVATPATPQADLAPFVPWHPVLPSPQPSGATAATPVPGAVGLEAFLALSAVLTGIDDLNPQVGRIYLDSLAGSDEFEVSLADLYQQAGFTGGSTPTIEEMEQQGLFEQEPTRALADKIVEYWYSGVYDTPEGEQAVATFADALVWHAVKYTKPLTICASPGFWAVAPQY
jgi:hypothetical protein